jgi:hypothetical protein
MAFVYQKVEYNWPLLILTDCPLKDYWHHKIQSWNSNLREGSKITCKTFSNRETINFNAEPHSIYILSYTEAIKHMDKLLMQSFKICIGDEIQKLKLSNTKKAS